MQEGGWTPVKGFDRIHPACSGKRLPPPRPFSRDAYGRIANWRDCATSAPVESQISKSSSW
jgi:hypothetical protein